MNRFFWNFKSQVQSVRDCYRFTALLDLGLDTYVRRMIMLRAIKQWGSDHKQHDPAFACLSEILAPGGHGRRVAISTAKPSGRRTVSVKADTAIPCRRPFGHLTLSFAGPATSKTPSHWLSVQSVMNHLENNGYSLKKLNQILEDCQLIEDF